MNLSGNHFILVFFAGFLASFSPCVYPVLPISVGIIAEHACGSRLKGFTLSLIYVLGLAVTYSALGLFASLTGRIFGSWIANPLIDIAVGGIIVFFGISLTGAVKLRLPNFIKFRRIEGRGYLTSFFLGITSALVVTPCTTPILGTILAHIAGKKNAAYGTVLLFVYSLGIGFIFMLAGTFSSLLSSLPKCGKWMVWVQRVCALILIILGIYFITDGIRRL